MKVLKGLSLLLVVLLQILGAVQFAQATEGDDNRHRLCTKFPLNPRCQGFTPAIALDDCPGTEAKCLFSGDESEQKKTDVGAVIAFGLPGLLAKIKTATIDLRYRSVEEAENIDDLVIMSKHKYGRELRSFLEKSTGLSARTVFLD